jgi:[ribosomal protein S5]-alanine N-acetyltransferase
METGKLVIQTPNLRLEPLRKDHAALLLKPLSDAQLYALMPQDQPQCLEDLERRYAFLELGKSPDGKEHWLNWAIFNRRTDEPLGMFQATVRDDAPSDIAYIVFAAHWRQGIAKEAGVALINHVFSQYPTLLLAANMDTRNVASIMLVESLGFERRVFIPNADAFKGMNSDEFRYELTRERWEALRPSGPAIFPCHD